MIEFITAPYNTPFTVALVVMFTIALMEGVGMVFGIGVSSLLETLLPELDIDIDVDVDSDADMSVDGGQSGLTRLLGWLRVGRVPVLMLLVVFLTGFGISGIAIQELLVSTAGVAMPRVVAVVPAFFVTLPIVRIMGGILEEVIPEDETSAVSERSFIGRIATVTLGTAAMQNPAQAKLRDEHGQTHYVMVEPDSEHDRYDQGTEVLLVSRNGAVFRVIRNTSEMLVGG